MKKIEKLKIGRDTLKGRLSMWQKINELVDAVNELYHNQTMFIQSKELSSEPSRYSVPPSCEQTQEPERKGLCPCGDPRCAYSEKEPECEHSYSGLLRFCPKCNADLGPVVEKPAKKECLCGGEAGPNHTCHPDKKDDLAERMNYKFNTGMKFSQDEAAKQLADEARKWAVEMYEIWRDSEFAYGESPSFVDWIKDGRE